MKCTYCGHTESKVIDSRSADEGTRIRRRRECLECGKRFTTYEVIEYTPILVVKTDGARQPFDPAKVKKGLVKACEKRPVSMQDIDDMTYRVEKQIYGALNDEVLSSYIGELVMKELKDKDHIAYVRFASVYRQFSDLTNFMDLIREFEESKK
ncbi:MAG: transcriptional regulator NrdR [Firmicutes bacterium]|nr:transcriptional regulator NrdR [Bacillota bacterium]